MIVKDYMYNAEADPDYRRNSQWLSYPEGSLHSVVVGSRRKNDRGLSLMLTYKGDGWARRLTLMFESEYESDLFLQQLSSQLTEAKAPELVEG